MAGQWIDIKGADGGTFKGYLAVPASGSGPGILLLQEIFGVNASMRSVADYYAEEGYVVLVPDLFWRMEPGEVEQVLDDLLAALGTLEDQFEIPLLFGVAGSLRQQLRESHDGGEGIVQLMRYAGHEFADPGQLFALNQLRLSALEGGDGPF